MFEEYLQKAQLVKDVQKERETRHLNQLINHRTRVQDVEHQRVLRLEVARLERMLKETASNFDAEMKTMKDTHDVNMKEQKARTDAIEAKLAAAQTQLSVVSSQCSTQAVAISALQKGYENQQRQIQAMQADNNSDYRYRGPRGGCVIL